MTPAAVPSFHAFTTKATGRSRRIVTPASIGAAFDPRTPPVPLPPQLAVQVLWDTGATGSVITAATAAALHLAPTGVVTVNHAGGSSLVNTYVVSITLPNQVGVAAVQVSECPDSAGQFNAIIGMDVITMGDLSISNLNGQTWMTFRIPSVEAADFVREADRLTYAGVPRNAPCPCGKTRSDGQPIKFKHCHGA
ncbi:MAG: aspartyl protease family protein [Acidobacteria bacterium]|nr:aspartyl protease family protein [Acidobacteriota bacterium]